MPVDGADQRLGFQLVEFVYAPGPAGEAYGGDDGRPMLVYGLGKKTRHSQQTTLTVTSNHGRAKKNTGDFDDGGPVPEAVRAKCGSS
jgi:hypothetical protein